MQDLESSQTQTPFSFSTLSESYARYLAHILSSSATIEAQHPVHQSFERKKKHITWRSIFAIISITPTPVQHRFKTTNKSEPDTSQFLKLLSLRVRELQYVSNRGLIYWHVFRVFVEMEGSERTECAERRKNERFERRKICKTVDLLSSPLGRNGGK